MFYAPCIVLILISPSLNQCVWPWCMKGSALSVGLMTVKQRHQDSILTKIWWWEFWWYKKPSLLNLVMRSRGHAGFIVDTKWPPFLTSTSLNLPAIFKYTTNRSSTYRGHREAMWFRSAALNCSTAERVDRLQCIIDCYI
jgi:hypothetical protein